MDQGPDWQVPGYADVEELGRGGFGRVVLARRLADGAPVAVKYLADRLVGDPGFRAEFQREARTLAGLQSPYTVRLYEYVETGAPVTGAAIVMEYVPGASLRRLLVSAGETPMPPEAALGILKGSLLGLGAAHDVGVVHRDYKPENVLVRPEGMSVLADFGIAVRAGDLAAGVVGTPPYMAPEQFTGASPSAAADVYAATAVFFECVTGRRPISVESRDLDSWARAHRAERVPVEMAPAQVQELIARGLAKDPSRRPAQALVFAAELERAAVQAYGPDWERIGRQVLVGALSGLAATGVLLSLVPGLLGPAAPLPVPLPVSPPAVPPPTMGPPPAPNLPPGTPSVPSGPPGLGAPPAPGYPSAPQSPYPHMARRHLWRHLKAKLGVGKAIATLTTAAVVVAGGTTAIVLTTKQKPKTPAPVLAVPSRTPQTSASPLDLGPLTGDWSAHSAGLSIKPDGTFTVFQRIYGGSFDNAHGSGRLTRAADGTADGEITQSDHTTGDGAIPLGTVHLTFAADNDTVQIKLSDNQAYTFCGADAPVGFCGA
ncbi:serine/threonine-protein kinase [Catenulispora subtropica]|uniref:non-specific serine/threonine protein kinase n=1 Tax=Catenulispora subtropica TaxID=450798 RepID=A0ABP5DHF5_9ACTN